MTFVKLDQLAERELIPGFRVRFIHSEKMTIAVWNITAGAALPEHSHPHEQICCVLEGELELTVGSRTRVMSPGSFALIPSNVPHAGRAKSDCRVHDVFHPVREDYR